MTNKLGQLYFVPNIYMFSVSRMIKRRSCQPYFHFDAALKKYLQPYLLQSITKTFFHFDPITHSFYPSWFCSSFLWMMYKGYHNLACLERRLKGRKSFDAYLIPYMKNISIIFFSNLIFYSEQRSDLSIDFKSYSWSGVARNGWNFKVFYTHWRGF